MIANGKAYGIRIGQNSCGSARAPQANCLIRHGAYALESQVKARRNPLAARVVSWLNLCRVCQDLEEQMLTAPQVDDNERRLHRALLASALASGEGLLLECADAAELKPLRLTPDGLAAKIESLRITFTQWHTELKPERQAAILQEAFGGQV